MTRGSAIGIVVAALSALPALGRDNLRDPTAALAAERLLPCPSQGAGFARTPGSRTCYRISGRVATGIDLRGSNRGAAAAPTTAGRIAVDTRTETDIGPVRTFVRIGQGRR